MGGKRGRNFRNMYKGHMDKAKGEWDGRLGVGIAGGEGGKMETTVLEQQ